MTIIDITYKNNQYIATSKDFTFCGKGNTIHEAVGHFIISNRERFDIKISIDKNVAQQELNFWNEID